MAHRWGRQRRWPRDNYLYPEPRRCRWIGVHQGEQRGPEQLSLVDEIRTRRPIRITIAGHSFVTNLMTDIERRLGRDNNFKFEFDCVNLKVVEKSGMHIAEARYEFLNSITINRPDIIYLELGTCDLKEPYLTADECFNQYKDLIEELKRLQIKKIIVGEVIERKRVPVGSGDINYKISDFNRLLQVEYDEDYQSDVLFWRHKNLWAPKVNIFKDGLHLNKIGNLYYFRSIRMALLKAMWLVLPQITIYN